MDSGIESQPSPVSILFFASILIFARLSKSQYDISRFGKHLSSTERIEWRRLPILEPDLYRSLSHVDVCGDALPGSSSRRRVLVEFDLESDELILGCPLALVVLLLLGQSALARRATGRATRRGRRGIRCRRRGSRGWRRRGRMGRGGRARGLG